MREHGAGERLEVVGEHVVAPVGERRGPRSVPPGELTARRHAQRQVRRAAGLACHGDDVVGELRGEVDALGGVLQRAHVGDRQHGLEPRQIVLGAPRGLEQDAPLVLRRRVVDPDAQQEAVHLRLGERVGAVVLLGVLRGHHEKGRLERVGPPVDGHLPVVHGLEQRALRARRRPVDLVGQHQVREHRPGVELELARRRIEHRHAEHVGGEQIARELDAAEAAADRSGQRVSERGLPHARYVLDQEVPPPDERDDRVSDGLRLAPQHAGDVRFERPDQLSRGVGPGVRHGGRRHRFCDYTTAKTRRYAREGLAASRKTT